MKTAMQQLLEEVTEARNISVDVNFRSALDFVRDTIEWDYIEKEKKQIMDAYDAGWSDGFDDKDLNDQYYFETFNNNKE
jgi:hypothetical protein